MLLLWGRMDQGAIAIKGTPHSTKLQHHWNLTIRLFTVISKTLVGGGVLPLCEDAIDVFSGSTRLGKQFGGGPCFSMEWVNLVWPTCSRFRVVSASLNRV